MSPALLLKASRTILLHASLAQLTPEIVTLDFILQGPLLGSLPTEVLLLIRSHLLPLVTAQLILQSEKKLAAHENALLSLLCRDCAAYNIDIYGPSVFRWPWDQFSGPCACRGASGEYATRINIFNNCVNLLQSFTRWDRDPKQKEVREPLAEEESLQFSPQCLDVNHVLELHLSREARRFARLAFKDELSFWRRTASLTTTCNTVQTTSSDFDPKSAECSSRRFLRVRTIWDVVSCVLREQYDCETFELGASTTPSVNGDWKEYSGDSIMEIDQTRSLDPAATHRPRSHPSDIPSNANSSPSSSTPSYEYISSHSPLWSLSSLNCNKQDRVYLSPLRQGDAVIRVYGFRKPSRSCEADDSLTLSSRSGASSEDNRPLSYSIHLEQLPTGLDPWVSRTLLVHARTALGLDVDYSRYCAATQNTHLISSPGAGSVMGGDGASGSQMQEGSQVGVPGVSLPNPDSITAAEATTMTWTAPKSSKYALISTSTGSALKMALALIQNRSGYKTFSCYRGSHYPSKMSRHDSIDGILLSDPPHQHLQDSEASSSLASLSLLTPRRLINSVLRFFFVSASVLGYSMYLTGFLITLCISIPLTIARVALTVVCFYSRPSSFRLL